MKLKLMVAAMTVTCLSFVLDKTRSSHYSKYKQMADSIFNANKGKDSFSFQQHFYNDEGEYPRVAVMTGHLFNEKNHALLLYSVNDSVFHIRLLEKKQSKWKSILEQTVTHQYLWMADDFVNFQDLDGDGQKELLLMNTFTDFHTAAFFRAFVWNGNSLTEIKDLEQYPNPDFDGKGGIVSYVSAGCADLAMYFQEGTINRFKVTKLKGVLCDCCTDSIRGDSCEIQFDDQKMFRVKSSEAPKFVPESYRESVMEKLEMIK